MIKIEENDIRRDGQKIGWLKENSVYNSEGEKIGYFSGNDIYNRSGIKIGYIDGHLLKKTNGHLLELNEIRKHIKGGNLSDLGRAAIGLLFGE